MDWLVSIWHLLLIVLGFGFLIFVHELGHFVAAKWAGIRTEAFAIGMGPVLLAYRKGIGLRIGSTLKEYDRRVREYLAQQSPGTPPRQITLEEAYRIGDKLGIGETEYSLRLLPIGGFVKMLGQEDANPNYVSSDPRSYQNCAISKRMVVVSAGVIMNILLAIVLFVVAFMVGVRFEAPIIGEVIDTMPAAQTLPDNAEALGITQPGLMPGDEVLAIDGDPARTFADIQIATAMSKPGVPLSMVVAREGYEEALRFTMLPEQDQHTRLLSLGIVPGSSARLSEGHIGTIDVAETLDEEGLTEQGVEPGMLMVSAGGQPVRTFEQFERVLKSKDGEAVATEWQDMDVNGEPVGPVVEAQIEAEPEWQQLVLSDGKNYEFGLLGLAPLMLIKDVEQGSLNAGQIKPGDVILRIGDLVGPRFNQAVEVIKKHSGSSVDLLLLRGNEQVRVTAEVNRKGQIEFRPGLAWDVPVISQPLSRLGVRPTGTDTNLAKPRHEEAPIAPLNLMPGDRIVSVAGKDVSNWTEIREALRTAIADYDRDAGVQVQLVTEHLFWAGSREQHTLTLSPEWCKRISELGWESSVPRYVFDPLQTTLSAEGNPVNAVVMGVRETHKLVLLVYLTIDRLVRGSVGVEQLRGPVGIVDLGSKIVPQGAMYFLFFLGMISVNLAVINFLPLPIVDGGLFLYLIYEKIKGQPPPIAFQNVATLIGLALIGTMFLVTFYNDVMRLIT